MTLPAGALEGIVVVDLSRVLAGPYCGQLLADHGASVIKVEGPQGDETRSWGSAKSVEGQSAYFEGLNRSKRNLGLDLAQPEARDALRRLLRNADVVLDNFKSGTMQRWGLGYPELADANPSLIACTISGYGDTGPLGKMPGYDSVLQAFSGLMSVTGESSGGSTRIGVPLVDIVAGLHAFSGILLALRDRERTGIGQEVEVTLLDSALALMHPHAADWLSSGNVAERTGNAHPMVAPYQVFESATGPIFIAASNDRQFTTLVEVLGEPEIALDPRFTTNLHRVRNRQALAQALAPSIAQRGSAQLAQDLMDRGVAASAVNDVGQALSAEQVVARESIVSAEGYRGVRTPVRLSRSGNGPTMAPVARGAHTAEVLREAGLTEAQIASMVSSGAALVN
ncbi:MAG TPA: CoA transferase [Terrimesophilobacter sp.]|nr:CoA transferase [Terrimesophilobacter sp.]